MFVVFGIYISSRRRFFHGRLEAIAPAQLLLLCVAAVWLSGYRAPSSGGGSIAPCRALSIQHLDVNADGGWARKSGSAQKRLVWTLLSIYSSDLDVHVCVWGGWQQKTWHDIISKLKSYFVPKQTNIYCQNNHHGTAVGMTSVVVVHFIIEFR